MKYQIISKKIFIFFFSFIFSILFPKSKTTFLNEEYLSFQEKYQIDTIDNDKSYIINIKEINGDVIIKGHIGSGVFLVANHLFEKESLEEVKKLSDKNVLSVLQKNEHINIKYQKNKTYQYLSNYVLNVPINTNLNISLSGGSINTNQVEGNLSFFTSGGDIVLNEIIGNISTKTNSGDIVIQNCSGKFRIHTNSGTIKLNKNKGNFSMSSSAGDTFINELIGNIELMNMAGSVYLNNLKESDIQCRISYGSIFAKEIVGNFYGETKSGDISIESLDGFCTLSSVNGNIDTRYLVGSVIIDVENGNIKGQNIYGPIQAFTSLGNIYIDIAFDYSILDYSVGLETGIGNINIGLPKKFPVNIEAEISDDKTSSTISSDIPIQFKNVSETYASGSIEGGTIPINLFSGKGHIIIREN